MAASLTGNAWKPRKCKHCKLTFVPSCRDQANARKKLFCTPKCRMAYHRSGGLNFDQLIERVVRKVAKILTQDEAFRESLADKLRVVPEGITAPPSRESSAAGS